MYKYISYNVQNCTIVYKNLVRRILHSMKLIFYGITHVGSTITLKWDLHKIAKSARWFFIISCDLKKVTINMHVEFFVLTCLIAS